MFCLSLLVRPFVEILLVEKWTREVDRLMMPSQFNGRVVRNRKRGAKRMRLVFVMHIRSCVARISRGFSGILTGGIDIRHGSVVCSDNARKCAAKNRETCLANRAGHGDFSSGI